MAGVDEITEIPDHGSRIEDQQPVSGRN